MIVENFEYYNKFLKKEVFSVPNPFGAFLPGSNAEVKLEILGIKKYIMVGDEVEHLTYKITILPSETNLNTLVHLMLGKDEADIPTFSTELYYLRLECNQILKTYLEAFGEFRNVICVKIENMRPLSENVILESKHDTLVSYIVKDILITLKKFTNSEMDEGQMDLPDEGEYYQTPFISGESFPFFIELYMFKHDAEDYKIDADAPMTIDEDNITIAIYYNPKKLKEQIDEIKNNLIYTVRHEYEHLIQSISEYENVTYEKTHRYKKDSLKTLLKRVEIEPQIRGYFLQSKKEKKPFDVVVKNHLDKLERNGQINFIGPERKRIVVDILVNYAKEINLPIKLS